MNKSLLLVLLAALQHIHCRGIFYDYYRRDSLPYKFDGRIPEKYFVPDETTSQQLANKPRVTIFKCGFMADEICNSDDVQINFNNGAWFYDKTDKAFKTELESEKTSLMISFVVLGDLLNELGICRQSETDVCLTIQLPHQPELKVYTTGGFSSPRWTLPQQEMNFRKTMKLKCLYKNKGTKEEEIRNAIISVRAIIKERYESNAALYGVALTTGKCDDNEVPLEGKSGASSRDNLSYI